MKKLLFLLCMVFWASLVPAQIPVRPHPPRLVNDFANILTERQKAMLEQKLVAFNDSTTNVICVVTVNSLAGYPAWQFAYQIGEQWGVQNKEGDKNGVVILLKPRNKESGGEVYISVGYGLEAAIPDAIAKRIIDQKMIPFLKDGNYYEAIEAALSQILPLAAGEISYQRESQKYIFGLIALFLFIVTVIVIIAIKQEKGKGKGSSGSNGSNDVGKAIFWGSLLGSGGRSSHSGGGSFGGFGGGGFGGGGAGGRF